MFTLEEADERYTRSAQPLLTPPEYDNTKMAAEAFVNFRAVGQKLQERLGAIMGTARCVCSCSDTKPLRARIGSCNHRT